MGRFGEHHPLSFLVDNNNAVIARALIGQPKLILADEPTGALDSETSAMVLRLLRQIHQQQSVTVLIITHDPKVAACCNRTIRISDGELVSNDFPNDSVSSGVSES